MISDLTIAFIGGGTMAGAMIKGLLRHELIDADRIVVAEPRLERGQELQATYGVRWTEGNAEAAHDCDVVILAVKPQVMAQVLSDLRGSIRTRALVLSIAAGVPIRTIADGLAHAAVVRAMPNTPAQVGEGITVWTATDKVTEAQVSQTNTILGAFGEVVNVTNESFLDMATALSGTGPAYVFLFMEAMIDTGVHLGFSRHVAEKLVLQTMHGTIEYARQSPRHPARLRNEVTSPGGTTAEALYQLEKGGLRTVIARGIWAAYQRSVALGQGNDSTPRLAGRSPEDNDK
ncbi:MAG: pyrroline-5-carboxylate reductase [Anaerolineae bacterium]|nr:pyrroline-5-carboxylate reductase [Anaerolineae bacterium]